MLNKSKLGLNNKGYMLIEIIVSATLAMAIGYYLIDLVFNFNNTNKDLNESIKIIAIKNAVTKSIMEDLNTRITNNIECSETTGINECIITFNDDTSEDNTDNPKAKLQINQTAKKIEYGLINSDNSYDKTDPSYYTKTFPNSIILKEIKTSTIGGGEVILINIPLLTNYDNIAHSIRILINKTISNNESSE